MKKQINPSIKAHLLRSALILISLVISNRSVFCQETPTPTPPSAVCGCCEAESDNNTLTGSATPLPCPACSGGFRVGYVGNNSGTLQFNGVAGHPSGHSVVTIYYTNGDATRYALLSVNGGTGTPLSFPSTGSFQTVGSIQTTITTNPGSGNTLEFYNPIVGSWAPDFDRLGISCATPTPTPTPTPTGTPMPTGTPTPTPAPTATPEGCYSNFTTAEGCDALTFLTTGSGNTGLGWRALFTDTIGNFNTGVGDGALELNNMDSNTAVGSAALLLHVRGTQNTAVGTDALLFNGSGDVSGDFNTATGYSALMNNVTGGSNTAIGWKALTANVDAHNNVALGSLPLSRNTSGNNNTTIGNQALENSVATSDHVAVGTLAGSGITIVDNNIIIGHHSGVHSRFGQEDNVCYIGNIYGANVDNFGAVARMVLVDPDGRVGTVAVTVGGNPGKSSPNGIQPQAIPDAANQAMLSFDVQELDAMISHQQDQIEILTAQIKEQIAEIQKVNARLETNQPAAKMIVNKPKAIP